jgi:hypothetical protein
VRGITIGTLVVASLVLVAMGAVAGVFFVKVSWLQVQSL